MSYLEEFKNHLEKDEGRVSYAYQDSEGYWTIGVGFLIDKRLGGGLRDDEINYILNNRVEEAHATAQRLVKNFDSLTDNRKVVILSLAYNLGYERLSKFVNTLKAVNEGRWEDAAVGLENSLWFKQVKNRARRLVELMRTG